MKTMVKRIIAILLLVLMIVTLSGCSGSSTPAGKCMWCSGVGYARFKDANGNWVNKTCSHCGGSGLAR